MDSLLILSLKHVAFKLGLNHRTVYKEAAFKVPQFRADIHQLGESVSLFLSLHAEPGALPRGHIWAFSYPNQTWVQTVKLSIR